MWLDLQAQGQATAGHVGRVDELLVDSHSHHIRHLVTRKGHLWGTKDVSIPVEQIAQMGEDTVYLKSDKAGVGKLPAVALHKPATSHA